MRRSAVIATLSTVLVMAGTVPAAAARPDPEFHARASDARVGRVMRVVAAVRHPQRDASFSATAVVHFACGDVSVQLEPRGRGYRAVARVPVQLGEIPGDVLVDVTTIHGEQTVMLQVTGSVHTLRRNPPPADCGATQQEN